MNSHAGSGGSPKLLTRQEDLTEFRMAITVTELDRSTRPPAKAARWATAKEVERTLGK